MLTPVEIRTREFKKTKLGGYSVEEVNAFLEEIAEEYGKIYKDNYTLNSQNATLAEAVNYYRSMENTIKSSIVSAEKNAEETKKLAEQEADQIIKKAELHAEELLQDTRLEASNLRNKIMELKSRYVGLKDGLKAVLESQIKMLDVHSEMFEDKDEDKV